MGTDDSGNSSNVAGDLAAAIHETTNALTVILGWVERARKASGGNDEALAALSRATRYARSARNVMRRVIGADVHSQQSEHAGAVALRSTEDLAIEARRAGVLLEDRVHDDWGARAVAHPDTVWQILTNLLLNAIAVTPSGGRVLLELRGHDGMLCFRVSDDGPGIDAELRSTLFTSGVSKRSGGAGIGLRHAHALAIGHGGRLELVTSPADARGACFELWWPAGDDLNSSEPPPRSRPPAALSLSGARVLLLEDDAAIVDLLELSLQARGATVTSVTTAEALRSQLDDGGFDVMLVDLSPLDGKLDAAIDQARATNPGVHVVVISGSVSVQPRPDILWVRKPFEPAELVTAIVTERGSKR